jgi:hypothetical protein
MKQTSWAKAGEMERECFYYHYCPAAAVQKNGRKRWVSCIQMPGNTVACAAREEFGSKRGTI